MKRYLNYIVTLFSALLSLSIFFSCMRRALPTRQAMDSQKKPSESTDKKVESSSDLDKTLDQVAKLTPLGLYISRGHKSLVLALINSQSTNINDTGDAPPSLFYALQCKKPDIALALLQHPRHNELDVAYTLPETGDTALHVAVEYGYTEVVKKLINKEKIKVNKVNINAQNNKKETPLFLALKAGQKQIAHLLLEVSNIDLSVPGYTHYNNLLDWAVNKDDGGVTRLILKNQPNFNSENHNYLLRLAASKGYLDTVKAFLERQQGIDLNSQNEDGNTVLHVAAREGHTEVVKEILNNKQIKIDINAQNKEGNTALHIATMKGRTKVAKLLINKEKINLNVQNEDRNTVLHLAARAGHPEVVQELLLKDANIDVNAQDKDGDTALHVAADKGHLGVVEALVEAKADVNSQNNANNTPLHLAVYNDHVSVVKFLVELLDINLNVKNNNNKTPLNLANDKNYTKLAQELVNISMNLSQEIISDLQCKDHYFSQERVEYWLSKRLSIDAKDSAGKTLLFYALNFNQGLVPFLIKKGADVNAKNNVGWTPLLTTLASGDDYLKIFMEARVPVDVNLGNNQGETPLMYAAIKTNSDVVEFLIKKGAVIDAQDIKGKTPLMYAARNNNMGPLKVLLAHKAKVHIQDKSKKTALDYVTYDEMIPLLQDAFNKSITPLDLVKHPNVLDEDILKYLEKNHFSEEKIGYLLDKGLKIDAKANDEYESTLLMLVVKDSKLENRYDITQYLIGKGANLNLKDKEGDTVLHLVVRRGLKEIVQLLLDNNIDDNITNQYGATALDEAKNDNIIALLSKKTKN
ncbi:MULTISPECIES: ankyrin repeat domain-containing protein [Candidatus Cardinium]|uniref:ankyrin repeat domain-containing protein n=1 Tax=Candidatus Cardinium TaxID=273135 RepID=UPI001FAAA695|nr:MULTISPECIES: ankyrin repeat domain-containing protein [Cardinium]